MYEESSGSQNVRIKRKNAETHFCALAFSCPAMPERFVIVLKNTSAFTAGFNCTKYLCPLYNC